MLFKSYFKLILINLINFHNINFLLFNFNDIFIICILFILKSLVGMYGFKRAYYSENINWYGNTTNLSTDQILENITLKQDEVFYTKDAAIRYTTKNHHENRLWKWLGRIIRQSLNALHNNLAITATASYVYCVQLEDWARVMEVWAKCKSNFIEK